ncbi:tRNA pseudouridine(13) synthase TruD [Planctomycetota bacterium]
MTGPFITEGLPPLRGSFREEVHDFEVEELPAYKPCGAGTHTYLWIEKRGVSTREAARRIARALSRPARDVGYAGLKDARAVARQYLSLEHVGEVAPERIADGAIRLLEQGRHRNKLKPGHLKGNRFRIRLRRAGAQAEQAARTALSRLEERGVPNRFGRQRFGGPRGTTAPLGFLLLKGQPEEFLRTLLGKPLVHESPRVQKARTLYEQGALEDALGAFPPSFEAERSCLRALLRQATAEQAARAAPRALRRLYVSAAQSQVFNDLLAERIELGLLSQVEEGDVCMLHTSGGSFVVEEPEKEQRRLDSHELSPAGPLFGTRLLRARGRPAERESRAFLRHGVELERRSCSFPVPIPRGARRAYRIILSEPEARSDGEDLLLSFTLPKGAYATSVVTELLQQEVG